MGFMDPFDDEGRQILGAGPLIGGLRYDSGSPKRLSGSGLYWLTDERMARLSPYVPKSHGSMTDGC